MSMKLPIVQPMVQSMRQSTIAKNDNNMVLTVRTTGIDETFTLPFQSSAPVNPWNAIINWGDGTSDIITTFNDPALAHEYAVADDYDITISGSANCVNFNNGGDRLKLIDVKQWGRTGWTNCNSAFRGCDNCVFTAGAVADTSAVIHTADMFRDCVLADPDVSGFDTSMVLTMTAMFRGCIVAQPDVSNFNTPNLTQIQSMFFGATLANPNISGFDIGLVTTMDSTMSGSGFGDANYDLALVSFNNQSHQNTVTAHFGTATPSAGAPADAKTALLADSWVITDGLGTLP